jgi:glucokinase
MSAVTSTDDGLVAIDIGGTGIKGIALDGTGRLYRRIDILTPVDRTEVFERVGELVDALRDSLEANSRPLRRLGVACPGLVDAASGVVHFASNLDWRDLELRRWLTGRFGVEAVVENDARAGALAEHAWAGTGEADDLAFIPLGTGVSAAYYIDGRLARGATNAAGEFGHVRAVGGGELCTCGNLGCVEVYTSAANILARYARSGGTAGSTPEIVARLDIDPLARRVWDDATDALAVGLSALVTLLDPSRIVIGGGLSLAGDALLVPLRDRLRRQISWRTLPPIDRSALGSHSTLVGAALLGWSAGGDTHGADPSHRAARSLGAQLDDHEGAITA